MGERALRPGAQAFDEIRIVTIPRWRSSGLSGSEWRYSAQVQLLRKGVVVQEAGLRDVQTAAMALGWIWLNAIDEGKGGTLGGSAISAIRKGARRRRRSLSG